MKPDLDKVLSDDAAVMLICTYTRQESGLSTSPKDVAEFLGWAEDRATEAAAELVDYGVVTPLATARPEDVS